MTAAESILKELGVTEPSDIDLEAIAWTLGARVRYRLLDGCEARIIGSGAQAIITVNSRSQPRRQRFSLAHELGHWKHHGGQILVCRSDDIGRAKGDRPLERTADAFAADLLMPGFLFDPIARSHPKLSFKAVRSVADAFDVSYTSTAIRLLERRHSASLLVCHGPNGRKWFTRSPDVPEHWFPRANLEAESSALNVLFGNKVEDSMPRRVRASAWFDSRRADRYEVEEQTIRTSNDEILTLVLITDRAMLDTGEGWR